VVGVADDGGEREAGGGDDDVFDRYTPSGGAKGGGTGSGAAGLIEATRSFGVTLARMISPAASTHAPAATVNEPPTSDERTSVTMSTPMVAVIAAVIAASNLDGSLFIRLLAVGGFACELGGTTDR
jgi:hypothetical protein